MAVPFFDADAVREAVTISELIDAVEDAYRDVAAGRDRSPVRSRVALDDGDLLLMPGLRRGASGASVKLVTVMPSNAARGLPVVHAVVAARPVGGGGGARAWSQPVFDAGWVRPGTHVNGIGAFRLDM